MTRTELQLNWLQTTLVPVEAEDVAHVIHFRDQRMAARRGNGDPKAASIKPADEVAHVEGQGNWRRSELEQLRDWISDGGHCPAPNARYRGLHTLFDLTADADGGWITKAEAEQAAEVAPRQLQNELSALTKLGRKFTGEVAWPIQYRQIARTFSYRMNPVIASWWTEGRAK